MKSNNERKLVVSFHDLHPGSMACCRRFLDRLIALGVPRASLLVVPNWYGREPITDHPDFCAWLREQPHDISLHGWMHAAQHKTRGPMEWLVANHYTAGEGEFYRLPASEAKQLVEKGLELFHQAGLSSKGFIAPAWLMDNALLPMLGKVGFRYSVTLNRFFDISGKREFRVPVLCTTSRTPMRRTLTRPVVSLLAERNVKAPVIRIAVHPIDFQYPKTAVFIDRLIAESLETRQPMTYLDLCQ